MMRIAVDMDEVLADTLAGELEWLRSEYGYQITPEQTAGHPLTDLVHEKHQRRLEEILLEGSFFANLPVMNGSQQVMQELTERHEVFIATAAMEYPGSFAAKFQWLTKYFPFIPPSNIVFCGDKSILSADYLIDDNDRHFRCFRGQGILFTAPHNLNVSGYPRVNGWVEIGRMFLTGLSTACDSVTAEARSAS
jgi:5'(3')-deoxyribonucleotidase